MLDKIVILAIYRSPSFRKIDTFINSLDSLLLSLRSYHTITIIGDLNINLLDENTKDYDMYMNLISSHAMLPAHLFPTRGPNCLDHVILKSNKPAISLVIDSLITDHNPVPLFCELENSKQTLWPNNKITRFNLLSCITELECTDFRFILNSDDAETASNDLVRTLSAAVQKHTSVIKVPSRLRIIKPWVTPGLLKCIHHRDNLYKRTKKQPQNEMLCFIYKRYKNYCNNLLKKIKKEYERVEFFKT